MIDRSPHHPELLIVISPQHNSNLLTCSHSPTMSSRCLCCILRLSSVKLISYDTPIAPGVDGVHNTIFLWNRVIQPMHLQASWVGLDFRRHSICSTYCFPVCKATQQVYALDGTLVWQATLMGKSPGLFAAKCGDLLTLRYSLSLSFQ